MDGGNVTRTMLCFEVTAHSECQDGGEKWACRSQKSQGD